MILGDDEVDKLTFGSASKDSTLIRTDKFQIDLNKNITVDEGISGNSVIHCKWNKYNFG